MKSHLRSALALGLLALSAPGLARAATLTSTACTSAPGVAACALWATSGSLSLPGGQAVALWGYAGDATSAPGLPGPLLIVNQGDAVTVTLTNNLPVPTALHFPGQDLVPDLEGIASTASRSYTFTAGRPGTYLYEAGLLPNAQHQAAMGMYGALIVRPAVATQAYDDPGTAFVDEALVVLGEVDLALGNAADPAAFDLRDYAPQYFLINGKAFPETEEIATAAGNTVLLRYLNAGIQHHSMSLLGLRQTVVAKDGSPFTYPTSLVAETVAPGQTMDAIVTIPAGALPGARFAVFDGSLKLHNGAGVGSVAGIGGMLTFLRAGTPGTGGSDLTGPATTAVAVTPNPTTGAAPVTLSATVSDAATGGSNVVAAEIRIDSTAGAASAMSGAFGSPTVAVATTLSPAVLAGLPAGNHLLYVRGQDAAGNWGPFNFAVLNLDKAGPTTSAVALSPNPTNGSAAVALSATGSDVASGGGSVIAAEWTLDGGPAAPMSPALAAPVASFTAALAAAQVPVDEGPHTVAVRSQDALGNWGPPASATLRVDRTGPAATVLGVSPPATNGTTGLNATTLAVRVSARFADAVSAIAAGEGFFPPPGAPAPTAAASGTGFPFVSSAGGFRATTEDGYADIPLTSLSPLPDGVYPIYLHGKDAAGNWGSTLATASVRLDRGVPAISGVSASPSPTFGAASVALTATGTDAASGIARGEWFEGADPGAGNGNAMTATPAGGSPATVSAAIPVSAWTVGSHTLAVRVRDGAGNWSPTGSTTVQVVPDAIFADGFEAAPFPAGWTSRSTTTLARLNRSAAAALVGASGMQAQGNNTNHVQYSFGTAANPASPTYDARFYFRPNGNTSTGKDVLAVASATGFGGASTLFRVRYRLSAGQAQVQLQVGTANANAAWVNVAGASANLLEVTYQAAGSGGPSPGTVRLYVGGALAQTLPTTSTASATAVRLGSVTATGNATLMHFDAFASKRTVASLIGP